MRIYNQLYAHKLDDLEEMHQLLQTHSLLKLSWEETDNLKWNTIFNLKNKQTKNLEFPSGLSVKDGALSLPWLGFNPWARNFHMPQAQQKKKKKKKKKKKDFWPR